MDGSFSAVTCKKNRCSASHAPKSWRPLTTPGLLGYLLLAIAGLLLRSAFAASAGKCSPGCYQRGVCNEELGRCDCYRTWRGPDCSEPAKDPAETCERLRFTKAPSCALQDVSPRLLCVNDCNGRGRCLSGWCHCAPGYFGADCSLSLGPDGRPVLLEGLGYKPRKQGPRIYVYELPPAWNTWYRTLAIDRPLMFAFWQRLLSSGMRTVDAEEADYFLIPMNARSPTDGVLIEQAVLHCISKTWPYWNATGGARHLVIHTGDTGRQDLTGSTRVLLENVTMLQHWGLTLDVPSSKWIAAHKPLQDIVVPIFINPMDHLASGLRTSPHHPRAKRQVVPKTLQLLFAGRICGGYEKPHTDTWPTCPPNSLGYSAGVRQAVHAYHWNRTGFSISVHNSHYFQDLIRSRFCLAPPGGGHGHRQILVSFSGCTPLIIGDNILQPFEPSLNWSRFSVSVPQAQIPDLHQVLQSVTDEQYEQLQSRLACAAQHFAWSSMTGAFMQESGAYDAFETTLQILRVMRKHPGVDPSLHASLDPELAAFMECRSHTPTADSHSSSSSSSSSSSESKARKKSRSRKNAASSAKAKDSSSFDGGDAAPAQPSMLAQASSWFEEKFGGAAHKQEHGLCSMSSLDRVSCQSCLRKYKGLPPGGAVCCGATHLSACPKLA